TFGYPIISYMGRVHVQCFHDIAQSSVIPLLSSPRSSQSAVGGESTRSSPFLGTNRAPRTFTEGRISSAIQRRTVLTDVPVRRAISPARRKSGASVISDPPGGTACCQMARGP